MRENKSKSSGLTKEEFSLFREIISMIELKDLFITSLNFRRNVNIPNTYETKVFIKGSDTRTVIKESLFNAEVSFFITLNVRESEEILFESEYNYMLSFLLKDKDSGLKIGEILKNERIAHFFSQMQLTKLVWPYLREDFNSNLLKSGLQRITLPLIK